MNVSLELIYLIKFIVCFHLNFMLLFVYVFLLDYFLLCVSNCGMRVEVLIKGGRTV